MWYLCRCKTDNNMKFYLATNPEKSNGKVFEKYFKNPYF